MKPLVVPSTIDDVRNLIKELIQKEQDAFDSLHKSADQCEEIVGKKPGEIHPARSIAANHRRAKNVLEVLLARLDGQYTNFEKKYILL